MEFEWVETDGNKCPIPHEMLVEIERRDGSRTTVPAGYHDSRRDCFNSWKHNGGSCDIVRYRIASAA